MFTLLLLIVSTGLSLAVFDGIYSRAAFAHGAQNTAPALSALAAALLAVWLGRWAAGTKPIRFAGIVAIVFLVGYVGVAMTISGDYGVRSFGFPVLGLLVSLPLGLFAWIGLGRFLRRGTPCAPVDRPAVRPVFVALTPALLFSLLPWVLEVGSVPAELGDEIAMEGLTGLLFAEIAAYGPAAAVLIGLGLDDLDRTRPGGLSRVLFALAVLALLGLAIFVPYETHLARTSRLVDGKVVQVPFPFDAVRRAVPLFLLALGLLVRDQLGALARRERALGLRAQLAVVLLPCVAATLLVHSFGLEAVPITGALACGAAWLAGRRLRAAAAP